MDFTPEQVIKKLSELDKLRGRKGTDRNIMIEDLKCLSSKATTAATQLKVNTTLASALFDVTLNKGENTYMEISLWRDAHDVLLNIVKMLMENPKVRLSEDEQVEESFDEGENEEEKKIAGYITRADEERKKKQDEEKKRRQDEEKNRSIKMEVKFNMLWAIFMLSFND